MENSKIEIRWTPFYLQWVDKKTCSHHNLDKHTKTHKLGKLPGYGSASICSTKEALTKTGMHMVLARLIAISS